MSGPDGRSPRPPCRFVVIGACGSTRVTLEALLARRLPLVGVLGLSRSSSRGVSDFEPVAEIARAEGVPVRTFHDVNAREVLATLQRWAPDVVLVVGLSQLVGAAILEVPSRGCVGFHPTLLPAGRGRAPIAWTILDGVPAAATFFRLRRTADSGEILEQEPFPVPPGAYAEDVMEAMYAAMERALTRLLPRLAVGDLTGEPQVESRASYYGVRRPGDGLIDWSWSADRIHTLVRAASRPHPGAYTYLGSSRVVVWRAEPDTDVRHRGQVGRVVDGDPDAGWLVQTGDGLLRLTEIEIRGDGGERLRVGADLGVPLQDVCVALERRLQRLETRLARLEDQTAEAVEATPEDVVAERSAAR